MFDCKRLRSFSLQGKYRYVAFLVNLRYSLNITILNVSILYSTIFKVKFDISTLVGAGDAPPRVVFRYVLDLFTIYRLT